MYIGQTGRTLEQRIKEHKYYVSRADQEKAVCQHVSATDHPPDWLGARMVYRSANEKKRLVVESSLIKKIPNYNLMGGAVSVDPSAAELIINCNKSILINANN